MNKIAVSLLNSNDLKKDVENIVTNDNIDLIHIDIMDGKFVPNNSNLLEEYDFSECIKPLDIHYMCENPYDSIVNLSFKNVNNITVHIEIEKCAEHLELIRSKNIKCGIAINPETDIQNVLPLLELCDIVLIMCVSPGYGGQTFNNNVLDKIKSLRTYINKLEKKPLVEVDGGINELTSKLCDADVYVSGSYLLNDLTENSIKLKNATKNL